MKLIIGFILLILCTFLGFYFSKKYTYRKNFYNDFYNFNKKMKNEVSFSKNTIISIVKTLEKSNDFNNLLIQYFIEKKEFVINNKLCEEEKTFLIDYIKTLGQGDSVSQIAFLDNSDKILTEKRSLTIDEDKKYKTLYIKIGFLFGLIILIALL